ncbi:MAG: hypothetical protein O7D86_01925 [Proteobacteria bacterium]|nr:hypothetical protein [Pseudomonadota bacterium]
MKKDFLSYLVLLFSITHVNSQQLSQELKEMVENSCTESSITLSQAESVLNSLKIYHLIGLEREVELIRIINDSICSFKGKITDQSIENSEIELIRQNVSDFVTRFQTSWKKIQFAIELQSEIERENEILSVEYHNLWSDVFLYRTRISTLYIQKKESNMFYGGVTGERTYVIKNRIYEAGSEIYDDYLMRVRNINQANYYDRIQILQDAKTILVKLEKLLFHEDTKQLEKNLKKDLTTSEKLELIKSFSI